MHVQLHGLRHVGVLIMDMHFCVDVHFEVMHFDFYPFLQGYVNNETFEYR